MILTKAQRKALLRVWLRTDIDVNYRSFRRGAVPGWRCVMAPFKGAWVCIDYRGNTTLWPHQ